MRWAWANFAECPLDFMYGGQFVIQGGGVAAFGGFVPLLVDLFGGHDVSQCWMQKPNATLAEACRLPEKEWSEFR